MKKYAKLLAGVLAAVMLAGCTVSQPTPAPVPVPEAPAEPAAPAESEAPVEASGPVLPDGPVTLRVSWWGSDNRHEAIQQVADLYTAKHPNVTIETEYGAFDGWQQKVTTQLAGKSEPDVMQVNYNWVHSFGKGTNVFYDLNLLSDYIDLSNWDAEQIASMTVGGEVGAVPHGVTARANLYNKALFADAGIEFPATYEEVNAAGAIIGANNTPGGAENKYVFTHIGEVSTDLFIAQMLYNKTGKVMQEGGKVSYTVEEVTEILNTYKSFEDSKALPTFQEEDPIQNESNPVWTSGRSGGVYEWTNSMDKYLLAYKGGEAQDEIGVAPYITEDGSQPTVYVKPNLGYAVSKNSANPQYAADFLNFMFTDKEAVLALNTSIGISSNHVTAQIQEEAGMLQGAMKEGYALVAEYPQIVMDPYFEDSNVRGARYAAIEAFRSGAASAEQAANDYVVNQQAELDKLFQ